MKLTPNYKGTTAQSVQVSCIRCHARKRLSDTVADLDGPAFVAYFCDPGCVPVTAIDAEQVYFTQGWQRVGDEGWRHS